MCKSRIRWIFALSCADDARSTEQRWRALIQLPGGFSGPTLPQILQRRGLRHDRGIARENSSEHPVHRHLQLFLQSDELVQMDGVPQKPRENSSA